MDKFPASIAGSPGATITAGRSFTRPPAERP